MSRFLLSLTFILTVVFLSPRSECQVGWNNTSGSIPPFYDFDFNWSGGITPNSFQTARFDQSANYEVWWDSTSTFWSPDVGRLEVVAGNVDFVNQQTAVQPEFFVNGFNEFTDVEVVGSNTLLTIRGLHLHSLGGGQVTDGGVLTLDGSPPENAQFSVDGEVGFALAGTLNVQSGAVFNSTTSFVGPLPGSLGTANITGAGSLWNHSANLIVGDQGEGVVNVGTGGSVVNRTGYIALNPGSVGDVFITANSTWNSLDSMVVGGNETTDGGAASVIVGEGGNVFVGDDLSPQPEALVSVSDNDGQGLLVVRNGGLIQNAGEGMIAFKNGSNGSALVTGGSSTWSNDGELQVGRSGDGILEINDGGLVSNTFGFIAADGTATGQVLVTGTASNWSNSESLFVGNAGIGSMNVLAGGSVNNTVGEIGTIANSDGTATVNGVGSQWTNSEVLVVGNAGTGALNVNGGGVVSSASGQIALTNGATGTATISNGGSQWAMPGDLTVGVASAGTLTIETGGSVTNAIGDIGSEVTGSGTATISGAGASWANDQQLLVGNAGTGDLSITQEGTVTSSMGEIGVQGGSTGTAMIGDLNSSWSMPGNLIVGKAGSGSLEVKDGGSVDNDSGTIADAAGSNGVASVQGADSQWINLNELIVGNEGTGDLSVADSGAVVSTTGNIAASAGGNGVASVSGGGNWQMTDQLLVGGEGVGTLNVSSDGLVQNRVAEVGSAVGSNGTASVVGAGSQWDTVESLVVGNAGTGSLSIADEGLVTDTFGVVGDKETGFGSVTVSGAGSLWDNSQDLSIGLGQLDITLGGRVDNINGEIGYGGLAGSATVTGRDSLWQNTGELKVGTDGNGTLSILDEGTVENVDGYIGFNAGGSGFVEVLGEESLWQNWNNLYIGFGGDGDLVIDSNAVTNPAALPTVVNCVNDASLATESGSTGNVEVTGRTSQWSVGNNLYIGGINVSDGGQGTVTIQNDGTATIGAETKLFSGGTLQVLTGGLVTGDTVINEGLVSNIGGAIQFTGDFTNQVTGEVSGAGEFTAGAWSNEGAMLFNFGAANIVGQINNGTGLIAITNSSDAVFFDHVVMQAGKPNIEVEEDSTVKFEGSYNGGTDGLGLVVIQGSLEPGFSAAVVEFGGDLELTGGPETKIELGGTANGDFDQVIVRGNFINDLGSTLTVSQIDGFNVDFGQSFLVFDIRGEESYDEFDGLPEGALVTVLNGIGVYITYEAGDGNDIELYTTELPVDPADIVIPVAGKLLDGELESGNIRDPATLNRLAVNDDIVVKLLPNVTTNPAKQKVDLILVGVADAGQMTGATGVNYVFDTRMEGTAEGDVLQIISAFNYTTGKYDEIDSRDATNLDSGASISLDPFGDYVKNGEEFQVRITWRTVNPAANFWDVSIDQAVWEIQR